MYPPLIYHPAMVKKGETPKGQKRLTPRMKREKEEVMKTTKTLKAMVMGCLVIICMHGYAAADENAPVANLNTGAAHVINAQDAAQVNHGTDLNTVEQGTDKTMAGALILANTIAPWGVIPVVLTATTGLGMIYNALVPERNNKPENTRAMVYNAQATERNDKPEINKVVDLAAKDRD
jgi:peroxiredoxin family protein